MIQKSRGKGFGIRKSFNRLLVNATIMRVSCTAAILLRETFGVSI